MKPSDRKTNHRGAENTEEDDTEKTKVHCSETLSPRYIPNLFSLCRLPLGSLWFVLFPICLVHAVERIDGRPANIYVVVL